MCKTTRLYLIFILSISLIYPVKAQKTDSLLNVLKTALEDTNKVKLLNNIASSLRYNDLVKAIDYANQALNLAQKFNLKREVVRSFYSLGQFNTSLGKFTDAEYYLNKADSLSSKLNYRLGQTMINEQRAIIYYEKQQYDVALQYRLKALRYYEETKDKLRTAVALGNIAGIYGMMRQYDEALKYFNKALTIKQEIGDTRGESIIYLNMATAYYDQHKWEPAIDYFKKALSIQEKIGDQYIIAVCKTNLGNLYSQTKNYKESQRLHQQSFEIYSALKDTSAMAMSLKDLADVKLKTGDNKEAIVLGERAIDLIKHTDNKIPLKAIYSVLSDAYIGVSDYKKALMYSTKAIELERATYTEETAQKIAKQKELYESEKKEKDILLLQQQNASANIVAERQKVKIISIAALATVLFLLLVLIMLINRSRKKQKEIDFIKTKAELEQTALLAQMNPHFIFNALNSIQYYILSKETEYAYDYLAKFSKLIRQVLINSEQNTISLNKEIETLQLYIELERRRLKNRFEFEINYSDDFPAHDITIPTMLIQPFVENAIWHGIMNMTEDKKGKLTVNFILKENQLKIVVEDNGIGRREATLRKLNSEYKSVGVMFTQKRLELIKAVNKQQSEITITDLMNDKGNALGTRVEITIEIAA